MMMIRIRWWINISSHRSCEHVIARKNTNKEKKTKDKELKEAPKMKSKNNI